MNVCFDQILYDTITIGVLSSILLKNKGEDEEREANGGSKRSN